MRDEAVDYALRLIWAGVSTELHVFPRTCHGFDSLLPAWSDSEAVEALPAGPGPAAAPGERGLEGGPSPLLRAADPAEQSAAMKIIGLEVIPFETVVDRISFGQLVTDYRVVQTVTKVLTDEGAEGYYFGGHFHGDQDGLLPGDRALIAQFLSPVLAGQDPFDRAEIWRQLWAAKVPENILSVVDLALWDSPVGSPAYRYTSCWAGRASGSRLTPALSATKGDSRRSTGPACSRMQAAGFPGLQDSSLPPLEPGWTGQPRLPRTSFVDWDIAGPPGCARRGG